jgi:hypothetical protein
MLAGIVVYVPAVADHPATGGIARGSAIVGRPEPGGKNVRIYFEGGVHGQAGMGTLAGRAVYACGRLLQEYPTTASRLVPRDALIAVGTFEPSTSEIASLEISRPRPLPSGWRLQTSILPSSATSVQLANGNVAPDGES